MTEKQVSAEGTREQRQLARVDLRVIQPEFGTVSSEKTSVLESKVLHHDLLTRLEERLEEMGLLLDINKAVDSEEPDYSDEGLHDLIGRPSFIVAEGWATIEDYNRFDFMADNFKELAGFINRCAVEGIKQSNEYQELQKALSEAREQVKLEKNNQRKIQMKFQLKQMEQAVESMVGPEGTVDNLPDWLLKGIRSFITTFMPNRINLRVYPFGQNPHFAILSNLKRESFVDSDLENLTFAYGTRPNVLLTVFGLITSIPSKGGEVFDPIENVEENEGSEEGQFEAGFRQVFRAFEGFERFVRFSQYPRVTVYPIAVYQRLDKIAQDDLVKPRSHEDNLMSQEAEQVRLQRVNKVRDID